MIVPKTYDDLESATMLAHARLRVDEQCDLFKIDPTEEQRAEAARLLRAWWCHAEDYGVDISKPALTAGLAWVAVAAIRSLVS